MKKKYIIFSIVTLVLLVALITSFNYFKTTNTYIDDSFNNQTKITKGISMNLEQTAGAGDYKTVTRSSWPTEGYKFNAELSRCENGSTLSWDDTKKAVIVSGNLSDKCYVYFDIIPPITLAEYVISQYTGNQGDNALYYHTSTLTNGAGDNSYRYAGANPNNYVCFGSDASPCPEDNLYRIIGVFGNQVKLIKATIAKSNLLGTDGAYNSDTSYQWSSLTSCPSSTAYNSNNGIYQLANKNTIAAADFAGCNEWHYSDLNKTNLNTNFVNNIGSTWSDKIATTTWKVGGGSWANIGTSVPKTAYQYEVGSNASRTTYEAKIGLMYVSDYYYGASASAWTLVGYDSSVKTNDYRKVTSINWLYLGSAEWTISRIENESYPFDAFTINSGHEYYERVISSIGARPSFNLLSSITYVSGDGTKSNPIRLS